MTIPDPVGLRCAHPCLPMPCVNGRRLTAVNEPTEASSNRRDTDRLRVAAQLLAATSLLADLELWPGRTALRSARIHDSASGPRARLTAFPKPLAAVSRRLGGGEGGATALRTAALEAIRDASGLSSSQLPGPALDPGPFLHVELGQVLDRLPLPLDVATARSLWAMCLPELRLPLDGEVVLRGVAHDTVADRLAAATWSALERARRRCCVWRVGADQDTGQLPSLGAQGVLVVTGLIGAPEIAAAERWAARPGCAAIVLGRFPAGWSPPGPEAGGGQWRLLVAGTTRERARRVVEGWSARLEPGQPASSAALTEHARTRFRSRGFTGIQRQPADPEGETARRILGLLPDGLPEGFLALHAPDLLARLQRGAVADAVHRGGRWRLFDPRLLGRDVLHHEVAGLFAPEDPRRRRHLALGSGDAADLRSWAEGRLDALEPRAVGEVLEVMSPGALGEELDGLRAEACLWRHDLSGARSAMQGLGRRRRRPLELWIAAVDTVAGAPIVKPEPGQAATAPRAVAVVAALALLRAVRRADQSTAAAARRCLGELAGGLAPPVSCWVEVVKAVADRPELIDDRRWRREVCGDHPVLWRELLHRAGLLAVAAGRPRLGARRLARALALAEDPGTRGLIEQDLGKAAADDHRRAHAEVHYQRSFVLLEAAGFQRLPSVPLGNLATSDLDQLRLERAAARLRDLKAHHDDPFTRAEMVRLDIARGNLAAAASRLQELPPPDSAGGATLVEALHLLHGVLQALEADDPLRAREHLELGGEEGQAWLFLLDAIAGLEPSSDRDDGWGVMAAARWRVGGRPCTASGEPIGESDPRLALAAAIVDRLAGDRVRLDNGARRRHAQRLDELGAEGWARSLRAGVTADAEWLGAAARLAEVRHLPELTTEESAALVAGLGVSGLEVWTEDGRSLMTRVGAGRPGAEARVGRLKLVPLGGDLLDDPAWRLVRALLEPDDDADPFDGEVDDPDIAATGLHGRSEALVTLRTEIARLAPLRMTVLLLGETGVGKEVAARALHRLSKRRGRFVAVNVAAIPDALLEAELFGSLRGAFTGADRDRRGLVEAAEGGTLFLDEIGDLGSTLQAKVLRFLESFEVRAVGSDRSRSVDVRVVAATHHDLERRTREGTFRSDLYYRISAAPIPIPALRARREDILGLRDLFQSQLEDRECLPHVRWSPEAEQALLRHDWPGNVRELRHVVELARIRARGNAVGVEDLAFQVDRRAAPARPWNDALDDFRRDLLRTSLARNDGNRSATARELGISRQALLYHLRILGVVGPAQGEKKGADLSVRRRKEEV